MNRSSLLFAGLLLVGLFAPGCKSTQSTSKQSTTGRPLEPMAVASPGGVADAGSATAPSSTQPSSQQEMPDASEPVQAFSDIPFDPAVVKAQLDNGLTYYIRQNSKPENRAELRLVINAGSIQEAPDQQGLAHFLEHMAFNGTENFPKNELINYLESVGTQFGPHLNAYTSFDETVYMIKVPTDSAGVLETGLQILEEWAHKISLKGEDIESERGVVIEEWRSSLGANERMQQKTFPKLLYESRYPERLPIGKVEILETFEYEALERFYRDWYRPELMAVIAVGDFEVSEVEALIREKFGRIPSADNAPDRKRYEVPDHEKTLITTVTDDEASFNTVRLLYKHPERTIESIEDYRLAIMDMLIGNMLNNRLSELTQQANPPFTFASAGYGSLVRTKDNFTSFAVVPPNKYLAAFEALLTENERAIRHGFTASELERGKKAILTGLEKQYKERDKTESRQLIGRYVQHFLSNSPAPSIADRLALYQQLLPNISLEEVNQQMQTYITDENRVIVMQGNTNGEMPSEEAIRERLSTVQAQAIEPYEDQVSTAPLMASAPAPAAIVAQEQDERLGTYTFTFENGVTAVLKPTDFKNDQILMRAHSPGGHSLYPDSMYHAATFADAVISQSGLGNFNNIELDKYLSDKVASVSPSISELSEGLQGSCSPQDQETFFQLIHLYFTGIRKDTTAFQAYMSRNIPLYANLLNQPEYYFQSELQKILYGNHPRRQFLPSSEELSAIAFEDVHRVYADRFTDASDFTFFFVGNFELDTFVPLMQRYLGSLPATQREESWRNIGADLRQERLREEVYKGQEPKSNVALYFTGDYDWAADENYRMNSTIQILRIMLRESMREDKGGVYGVRASFNPQKYPEESYSINISFVCSPENVEELIATALADIQQLVEEGPSESNLQKIREIQKKSYEENLKQNNFWLSYLYGTYLYDMDPYRVFGRPDRTEALTAADVQQAAQTYFDLEKLIQVVLYPKKDR